MHTICSNISALRWGILHEVRSPRRAQEDVNGEKLTVEKWWIFGGEFFTVWFRFFHGLRRFFTVCKGHKPRKILVSVKFVSAILGPGMGAPILWTPGKDAFFLQEKPCPQNSPLFGGVLGGGGSADFIFMGARIFLINGEKKHLVIDELFHG